MTAASSATPIAPAGKQAENDFPFSVAFGGVYDGPLDLLLDLVKTVQQVLDRLRSRPIFLVDEETVTVGQMIDYLRRRLSLEDRPLRLKQILMNVQSRQALVCMFLALLELVRLQAIQLRQDRLFGEILLRKHTGFDAVMAEQSAVRDDWK